MLKMVFRAEGPTFLREALGTYFGLSTIPEQPRKGVTSDGVSRPATLTWLWGLGGTALTVRRVVESTYTTQALEPYSGRLLIPERPLQGTVSGLVLASRTPSRSLGLMQI